MVTDLHLVVYPDKLAPLHGYPDILSGEGFAGEDEVIDVSTDGGGFALW